MALKQQNTNKGTSLETQGPAMQDVGPNPPNPSDQIFQGKPLPVRGPQDVTVRRPFQDCNITKSPLHYNEGPGTDEIVTSRRPAIRPVQLPLMDKSQHTDYIGDPDERDEYFGKDPNKYSENPNDAFTENGQWIRGT